MASVLKLQFDRQVPSHHTTTKPNVGLRFPSRLPTRTPLQMKLNGLGVDEEVSQGPVTHPVRCPVLENGPIFGMDDEIGG